MGKTHLMRHNGSVDCKLMWNRRTYTPRVAVILSEKRFGLVGRDITHVNQINHNQLEDLNLNALLPSVKDQLATIELEPDAKPMCCRVRDVPLAFQEQVKKEMAKLEAHGIIETVEPGGVMNASPVVWQRKMVWISSTMR